ncbi:CDP-glucose 4,6-dehydratase [Seleniivibrio woodruffii]|uniref:CDP-glucose 4,6-dehydratase n=1 Tax=Seleniivibrio woodruffii TaxID=1078050 RepID=UPI00240A3B9B|nr:CDP-glucose 4,6-dehydratase [Seleniivibrio woodruffii]
MESLVDKKLFGSSYEGRRVFLTGHTGFKGSWLAMWLKAMGADVLGYSLSPNTSPSHYELLRLGVASVYADIRNRDLLNKAITDFRPEIVFHLAAQPLVRYSYDNPVETYETNVIGTLNVFEASRRVDSVRAIVNITSDKCYENREWVWGYRENDPMGGYDPYSASKGCSEILTASYRHSYYNINDYGKKHHVLLASCRAGNVIGGGDWAKDRLVTDIMISVSKGAKVKIRNPYATRPWQHVLEPLSGYLNIGQMLMEGKKEFADGWNFGPSDEDSLSVESVVKNIKKHWDKIDYEIDRVENQPHEAKLLKLDCAKARMFLNWKNVWNSEEAFKRTVVWYKKFYEEQQLLTQSDLEQYIHDASKQNINWTLS